MRVISGTHRGRPLKALPGLDTRPTTDKVKESIFNIIQFQVPGAQVLDLFAGTGQMGIEALSRGAARAVFVDKAPKACKIVQENLSALHLEDNSRVECADSLGYLQRCREKFDLIFLDPPYRETLLEDALVHISTIDILQEHGIIICESSLDKELPQLPPPYVRGREYLYGKIKLTLYHRNDVIQS